MLLRRILLPCNSAAILLSAILSLERGSSFLPSSRKSRLIRRGDAQEERWLVIVFAIRFNDVELFRQWRRRGFTSGDNGGQFRRIETVLVNVTVLVPLGEDILVSLLKVIVKGQGNLLLLAITRLQNDTRQNDWY